MFQLIIVDIDEMHDNKTIPEGWVIIGIDEQNDEVTIADPNSRFCAAHKLGHDWRKLCAKGKIERD